MYIYSYIFDHYSCQNVEHGHRKREYKCRHFRCDYTTQILCILRAEICF